MQTKLIHSDCLEALKNLPDNSVDSVVTDPPYGLSFMGKKWDYDVPSEEIWAECLRVLKPGGHLLAFAGTRTQHRMAVRIEDAGFEAKARPTMGSGIVGQPDQQAANNRNTHPTVKPTDLMRYLCRLVTPPGGTVLDPFMGSGSTGKAAMLEGFNFIGIEREAEYIEIAKARINWTLLC